MDSPGENKDKTTEDVESRIESDNDQTNEQLKYTEHIAYEGDKCIYTEPTTKKKLIWNADKNEWCPMDNETTVSKEVPESNENYEFDGQHYIYTDKSTNITYKYIEEKKEWVVKVQDEITPNKSNKKEITDPTKLNVESVYNIESDTYTYSDPNDGTCYEWDPEKRAWFPKLDEEFLALYHINYGSNKLNVGTSSQSIPQPTLPVEPDTNVKSNMKKKAPEPPTWFEIDDQHNTAIYISGLPVDMTQTEVTELVSKCGVIARDVKGKDKIKIYKDEFGQNKGDAVCTYIKVESVDLALQILDGWQVNGKPLSVQRAKFQLKGTYDPSLKPKKKKKDIEKQKKSREKLFDWRPERIRGEPQKCERVVIIKNLFTPQDFTADPGLILEYQKDLRSECAKCGDITKIKIHDRHTEGVAQVTFREPDAAQACVSLLNGRWFGQRQISAEIWDGTTKYIIVETEEEVTDRLKKWDEYLDKEDEKQESTASA